MYTGQTIRSATMIDLVILVSYFTTFLLIRTAVSVCAPVSVLPEPPPTNILSSQKRQIDLSREKKNPYQRSRN